MSSRAFMQKRFDHRVNPSPKLERENEEEFDTTAIFTKPAREA